MLPIILNQTAIQVGLAGAGEALARRRSTLAQAGIAPFHVAPDADTLDGINVLFVAGLDAETSNRLAALARGEGILVNVEDVPELCDFHVPATIRRGDLLLTVSTGGKAPGLAKLVREWLEKKLGLEWSDRLQEIAQARAKWRGEGQAPSNVSQQTRDFVQDREWLS